ncbi:MAG: hypothetical protein MUO40_00675 [Anaerolineaceae bacterium]|nr:hypothetical protein [Anaerolineaceae bacterium]
MAYLAQPTSKIDYGVVGIGSFINVLEGFISLEQDVSPTASVSFNNVSIGGTNVITSVNPIAGAGISIFNLVSVGNTIGFGVSNTGVFSVVAGAGVSVNNSTGFITISSFGADLISTIGVTGDYTATTTDEYIGVFSAPAVTINLPTGITGRVYIIKDEYGQGSGKITIKPFGTEKIDNANNYIISVPYQAISVVFRGGQWRII